MAWGRCLFTDTVRTEYVKEFVDQLLYVGPPILGGQKASYSIKRRIYPTLNLTLKCLRISARIWRGKSQAKND